MRGEKIRDNARHQRIDIVEAGNLKIKDFSAGFFHGTSRAYLNDDPYPGTLDVTEFSAVSWNGEDQGVHLYNIAEKKWKCLFYFGDRYSCRRLHRKQLKLDGKFFFKFGRDCNRFNANGEKFR